MRKAISVLLTCVLAAGITGCSDYQEQSLSDVTEVTVSYENSRISYLGPEGTYTQEACGVFFEGEGEYIPYETVKDAVEALVSGECDYAVIPQENTIGGAVADYVDTLIGTPEVSVAGEVVLTINQNLLVMPGAELVTIHDRPLRTDLGSYSYVIECEGLTYEDYLEITDSSDMEFRYLGCFEVR